MLRRICVYGAGAIGGLLAARLARSGQPVVCISRGPNLAAIRAGGLTLIEEGRASRIKLECTDRPASLGTQDVVFLAVKSHAVAAALPGIAPLLGPDTAVVCLQNGIPWWYFYGIDSPLGITHLDSVDPGGSIGSALEPRRAIGAVVYLAAEQTSPGTVRQLGGARVSIGEPDGRDSARVSIVARLLEAAGIEAPVHCDIRRALWHKLSISAALNPLGVATGRTIGEILDDPATLGRLKTMIGECQAVALALGIEPYGPPAELAAANRAVAGHKTSMLADFERGRALEIEALTGAVIELGRHAGVATPELDAIRREVALLRSDAKQN